MKPCIRCKIEKPISEFYKNSNMKDGHINKCKTCVCEYNRNYDKTRIRDRSEYMAKNKKKYRAENQEKIQAKNKVTQAVKTGKLIRQPCERCGSNEFIEAHHEDYSKPLDVMWLCRKHHCERHKELNTLLSE